MDRVIVTHTDLDGVASAAVYCRITGCEPRDTRIQFVEPDALPSVLRDLTGWFEGGELVVCDLGPNASTFPEIAGSVERILAAGSRVRWFDHHVWEPSWASRLREAGVEVHVDRSTCAAGVVAKYAGGMLDDATREIVEATCAADIWTWDHPMAPKLFRVVGRYRGARGDRWNRHILELLYRGSLWSDELQEVLDEYVDLELTGYTRGLAKTRVVRAGNGCRVAVLAGFRGPPGNSLLAAYILSRTGADVAAMTRRFSSVSLRSRRVDVRRIAVILGGGGHPAAAGARLSPPLHVRIIGAILPPVKRAWFEKVIKRAVETAGCKAIGEGLARSEYLG